MVYVFKTSVKYKKQIKKIAPELDKINEIQEWNFDLEDCDKILRIKGRKLNPNSVSNIMCSLGFSCSELE